MIIGNPWCLEPAETPLCIHTFQVHKDPCCAFLK